ncbi:MAG: hypothetical protein K4571_05185 [Deltaproteobacteria bacterium]
MNHIRITILIILSAILFVGCAVTPIQREINLPSQDILKPLTDDTKVRLIIFNNSNKFWTGIDGSGKINLSLDGKGICRLSVGEYVIVETNPGKHTIDLEHRDFALFKSSHSISTIEKEHYVQVYATPVSNIAEITAKPEAFESSYDAIRF